MKGTLWKLALASSLATLAIPPDAFAGRGGGARGGYGGGGYGGGGNRGGGGGYGGGGGNRGGGGYGGGGQMGHSPSMSQPSSSMNRSQGSGEYGNRSQTGGTANRNPYGNNSNTGAAAAGAGYSNRNQGPSTAGAAAAGAGYSNRNQDPSTAGAAAAGAGYANRNQGPSTAGAAAAGAGYANRNQGLDHPGAAGAAAGAGYANRNQYDQYHPGMAGGYGYGNYGYAGGAGYGAYGGYGGVGAWGMGSPMYGWGYSNYNNAYYGLPQGGVGGQVAGPTQARAASYDYSHPISTTAAPPEAPVASQASAGFDQARDAFKQGMYGAAVQLGQQALGQMPNDPNLHEFVALGLFAQGQYDQAASPLYAVLSVGPGWNWTTLIGMYADADVYTQQIRALESYVKTNPESPSGHFVLGYHYVTQGANAAAATQFGEAARLKPDDKLSAQLAAHLQPPATQPPASAGAAAPAATPPAESISPGKLAGSWAATPAKDSRVALTIQDDGSFTWAVTSPNKPAMTIAGKSTLANGTLTLGDQSQQNGALVGQVAWQDDNHMTFRVLGAPQDDPGLKFER